MILPFIYATLAALIISPLVIWFYKKKGWVDDPLKNPHAKKTHKGAIPRGGGLIVFTGIILAVPVFLTADSYLIAILTGALLLTVVGVLDDIYDISPYVRLFTGLVASLIVIGSGIGIAYVSNPFGAGVIDLSHPQIVFDLFGSSHAIWILADLFALIFIMWNMNIINWANGVDGQLPGFVTTAAIIIGLLSLNFVDDPTQFNTTALSFIVAGAFFGLLFWNWYPQKIIPGYGAGSLAGYFLSILAILSGAKVATILMVLAIPTADGIFTILRRLRAHKSPFKGDRGHLHHKLIDVLGWSKQQVSIFYWATSLSLGLLSLFVGTTGKIIILSLTMSSVFYFMFWAKKQQLKSVNKKQTKKKQSKK